MATIVNNTNPSGEGTNYGMIVGLVLLVLIILVLALYGRNAFSGGAAPAADDAAPVQMNQTQEAPQVPAGDQGSDINIDVPENLPDVNVPENIDVNVNQQDQPAQ